MWFSRSTILIVHILSAANLSTTTMSGYSKYCMQFGGTAQNDLEVCVWGGGEGGGLQPPEPPWSAPGVGMGGGVSSVTKRISVCSKDNFLYTHVSLYISTLTYIELNHLVAGRLQGRMAMGVPYFQTQSNSVEKHRPLNLWYSCHALLHWRLQDVVPLWNGMLSFQIQSPPELYVLHTNKTIWSSTSVPMLISMAHGHYYSQ